MSLTRQASGIRAVKRDFSSNSQPSSSQSNDAPRAVPTPASGGRSLTATEQRLKAIQDALNGMPVAGEKQTSATGQKRPAPTLLNWETNKRRQLPTSWSQEKVGVNVTTQSQGSSRTISSTNVNKTSETTTITVTSSTKSAAKTAEVFLSSEQKHILKLVENEENVFYTGSAGTGKSVLLREIIRTLKRKYVKSADSVAVTASTGIAACNIGGVTIHSFAGIGLGNDKEEVLATRIRRNKKAMSRWLRTRVLIIDEISMVDGELFDKLARLGSMLRKNPQPFGGIQIVVTGDFFQLPPVAGKQQKLKFAFEAEFWPIVLKQTFNLTKVFRQSDPEFVDMLNEMRFGRLSEASTTRFRSLRRPLQYEDGVSATELFPRREDVDKANTTRMQALNAETHTYKAFDGGPLLENEFGAKMLENFMAPASLTLKLGAQVMLIKNLDETLVNGSMGTITEFCHPNDYATNPGDPYDVPASVPSSKNGKEKSGSSAGVGPKWPVVEFIVKQGSHAGKRRMLMQPETWKVELPNGELQLSRTQLPLILSWAMSIHKSQGQTLERVKVDLGRIFEKGQAYVALSRATSLEGLQVLNFDPAKVQAHPRVIEWSRTLKTVPL